MKELKTELRKQLSHKIVIPLRHFMCEYGATIRRAGFRDKRYIHLKKLKNIHANKRCFIVCTGPSLTLDDVETLKNEYTFGMNSIHKLFNRTSWRPTYYGIVGLDVYKKIHEDEYFDQIENAFVSSIIGKHIENPTLPQYAFFPVDDFAFRLSKKGGPVIRFSDDIYSIVYDAATVAFTLMQIAIYMGFKEIYLIGCDCDYSGEKQHFDDYGLKPVEEDPEKRMILAYQVAKEYADSHGIKIYNATRGGKLEVFERVNFDDLFHLESEK